MKNVFVRFFRVSAAAIIVMSGVSAVRAAVLTGIPMQGGMVMPMVSYHAADGRIHVTMPATVPALTPLLVSHPADSFNPADPWFDELDPSRRGKSFSRRYGFMPDEVDPLPEGTEMWIRKLSGSPELRMYGAINATIGSFDPIFGTDGVTNAHYWFPAMFHPTIAAPPGTNSFTATFEVYLVNSATGLEVPNSTSGPLVFTWTNLPDGRPALSLAQKIVIAWPESTTTNWLLESAGSPSAASWTTITNEPVMVEGQPSVVLNQNATQQYFRMRYVP